MFFHAWADVGRAVVATAVVFALIIVILRVVGAQAIARMSGYDMVATVTLGSIVATVAVSRRVTVSEGVAALLTLIVLQESIRFLQSRWLLAHHAVRQPPIVLVWEGTLLEDRLRGARISADEVRAAVRKMGLASISHARIVVLENDGEWSVIPRSAAGGDDSALHGLPIPVRANDSPGRDGRHAEPADPRRVP
jgi:uncharacterized membrane protein YcaP (DUF421 family)